jgi:hypothetical protein
VSSQFDSLQAVQQQFQDYILGALPAAPSLTAAVREQSGLKAEERLAIYHRAYRARLREALCEAYDKTWSYIGDEMFAELADSYVAAHPSPHRNLRWYGGGLAAHALLVFPDYPFIAELARLEWTLGLAFDAEDAVALCRADFAAIAPEAWSELAFALHPSAHIVAMDWNAVALWQAMAAGEEAPEPVQSPQPAHWLVWRQSGQPHFRSLPALEADALGAIASGLSFGAMCESACEQSADTGATMLALAGYLQHWLAQELLTAYSLSTKL